MDIGRDGPPATALHYRGLLIISRPDTRDATPMSSHVTRSWFILKALANTAHMWKVLPAPVRAPAKAPAQAPGPGEKNCSFPDMLHEIVDLSHVWACRTVLGCTYSEAVTRRMNALACL